MNLNQRNVMETTYTISHYDDEPIKEPHEDLSQEDTFNFLMKVDAYLYSVGEYDEDDDQIERLNGEEWLEQNSKA